jgi:hypothetical protein
MGTETTSVKSSMKIAQTPVLIASHGSTCLSVLERCRGDRDWVVEAADRIFADAFEIEIAFDEGVECAGQQHHSPQLLGPMTAKSRAVVGDPGPNRGATL